MNATIALLLFGVAVIILTKLTVKASLAIIRKVFRLAEDDATKDTHEFEVSNNTVCSEDVTIPCYAPFEDTIFIWDNKGKINHSCYLHESIHSTQGVFIKLYAYLIPTSVVSGSAKLPWYSKVYQYFYNFFIGLFHNIYIFVVEFTTFLETRKKCVQIGIWSKEVKTFHELGLLSYVVNLVYSLILLGMTYSLVKFILF